MRIPLVFELNHDEILQLEALQEELSRLFPDFMDLFREDKDKIHAQDKINSIISLIRNNAQKRSLGYYASRHEELLSALKGEINNSIIELVTLEKSRLFSWFADPQSWRENINNSFSPYLEILNDNERQDIMSFIEASIRNREQIFREAMKQEAQTYEAATAKKVRKITAPVDKVTQSLFNPSKNPALYDGGADKGSYNRCLITN